MTRKKFTDFSELPDSLLILVAGCFQALSDPTRLRILRELKAGERSVQELGMLFNCSQPNISRHLSILTIAGLVRKAKRGSYVFYSVADARIFGLCDNVCTHVRGVLNQYRVDT